jgi:hypothetical protein
MAIDYDDVVESLRQDPLYVDPVAEQELADAGRPFDDSAQQAVSQRLDDSPGAIYVAVLPGDDLDDEAAGQLNSQLGDGTYVVVFGDQTPFSAGSTELPTGRTEELFDLAMRASDGDLEKGLLDFTDRVDNTLNTGTGNGTSNDGGGGGGWLPLAILAGAGGGGFLLYRRNKRGKELTQLRKVREVLDEDITKYGEQLTALDVDLHPTSSVPDGARDEYGRALDLYETAKDRSDRAEKPADLRPVTTALEEGRWLLSCVDARLKDEPVPDRRLPCFFDPAHGPSLEDVQWAPPHGTTRTVPACRECAFRIGAGNEPESRMVNVGEGRYKPYWEAGPAYGAWAGGYFGALLPGMMVGTMLGHAMAMPHGDLGAGGGDGGGDFGGGGGDFGGGDFGGGDFGGF